ncbi:hypothetical protein PISMIDRAFT_623018 [Pisolithus microcarpus 441]|uniref:F-box domain-containing protein n=1 Tax=Pisolithus microcarpus 441 TaxID=765257 RepID=A0A0C9ZHT9_9AGAM|nr:hypothetical protein PISMIDRAFT_623018 [Pisolithus microcarpus 441]
MAARAKRAVTQLPSLPPELWDYIFELATHVPYTLVPEIFEKSIFIGSIYNREYHPKLRAALVTKRYLVRVCRQWWHMAIRYLYRAIYIGRSRSLTSLCNTLEKYAAGKGTIAGAEPLGQWTQRLDVAIRDNPVRRDVDVQYCVNLVTCLPNLAIFSIRMLDVAVPAPLPGILNALRNSASSIRVLDWNTSPHTPQPCAFVELVRSLPRLHTFRCAYRRWDRVYFPTSILSSLNTLVLNRGPDRLEKDRLTESDSEQTHINLRKVVLDLYWSVDSWEEFMSSYGTFITSVQILAFRSTTREINNFLDLVNRLCPHILQMTILVDVFSCMSFVDSLLPPVEYLGFMSRKFQETRAAYRRLFSNLAIFKDRVPTLRVIQFLDFHNVQCLITRHSQVVLHALKHEFAGSNLRIVDHEGNLLSERLMTV